MHGRFFGLCALSLGLAGCVSNPNAMVFGTNTTFGISAGSGATATPSIVVGYERQEAVLMPLVAAKGSKGDQLTSCDVAPVTGSTEPQNHPCILVGKGVTSTGDESDSLSVLASFGTDGSTTVNGQGQAVSGKITQYFATGLAARRLAERSGAAAVAIGPAAELSAGVLSDKQVKDELVAQAVARQAIANRVMVAGDGGFKALLPKMDVAAKTSATKRFEKLCADAAETAASCAEKILKTRVLDGLEASDLDNASKV